MQAALFQPPPAYMDSDDYVYTHGLVPQSYLTPNSDPLDPRAVNTKAVADVRRQHVRRLYDLLQLMLLRRDTARAARCLRLLMNAKEWRPIELWKMGLEVAMLPGSARQPLRYLQQLARTRAVLVRDLSDAASLSPSAHGPRDDFRGKVPRRARGTQQVRAASHPVSLLPIPIGTIPSCMRTSAS